MQDNGHAATHVINKHMLEYERTPMSLRVVIVVWQKTGATSTHDPTRALSVPSMKKFKFVNPQLGQRGPVRGRPSDDKDF